MAHRSHRTQMFFYLLLWVVEIFPKTADSTHVATSILYTSDATSSTDTLNTVTSSPGTTSDVTSSSDTQTTITSFSGTNSDVTSSPDTQPTVTPFPGTTTDVSSSTETQTTLTPSPGTTSDVTSSPETQTTVTPFPGTSDVSSSTETQTTVTPFTGTTTDVSSSTETQTTVTLSPGTTSDVTSSSDTQNTVTPSPRTTSDVTSSPETQTTVTHFPGITTDASSSTDTRPTVTPSPGTTSDVSSSTETQTTVTLSPGTTSDVSSSTETQTTVTLSPGTTSDVSSSSDTQTTITSFSGTTSDVTSPPDTQPTVTPFPGTTTDVSSSTETQTTVTLSPGTTSDVSSSTETQTTVTPSPGTTSDVTSSSDTQTTITSFSGTTTDVSSSTETQTTVTLSPGTTSDVSSSTETQTTVTPSPGTTSDVSSSTETQTTVTTFPGTTSDVSSSTETQTTVTLSPGTTSDVTSSPDTQTTLSASPQTTPYPSHTTTHVTFSTVRPTTEEPTTPGKPEEHTTPNVCNNGGTYVDNLCVCRPNFEGKFCDVLAGTVSVDTYERTANVTVKIDQNYTQELSNTSSLEYSTFVNSFTKQMKNVYKNIRNYKGVEILKISKGSIVVDYEVILDMKNGNNADEEYQKVLAEVENALEKAKNCTGPDNCLTFTIKDYTVRNSTLNKTAVCDKVIPEGFNAYYTAHTIDSKIVCISQCDSRHNERKTCNLGTCQVTRAGPTCFCLHTSSEWYMGSDCSLPVSKAGFYAGVGILAVVIVVTVITLSTFLILGKKKEIRNQDGKKSLMNQWLDDDFEWPPLNRTDTPAAESYSALYGKSRDLPYNAQSSTIFRNPSSYFPDSSVPRYPDPCPPYSREERRPMQQNIQLNNLSPPISVRIGRPQIRTSFET
ncbi:MUC3A protein, partial [Atractosteus spatula]|nr:MUC3A protein [Atractosteus spatula]